MGNTAHLRKQFKSKKNLHKAMKYIITSIRRKNTIISFMRFKWPLFVKS